MPYITYDEEDGLTKSLRLSKEARTIIGRDQGNSIGMPNIQKLSRNHCAIYYFPESEAYALSDLGSTNGTLLNGLKISADVLLADGDEIEAGGVKFKFHDIEQGGHQTHEVKTAEPVKAFGLADINSLEHTQAFRRIADDEDFRPANSVQGGAPLRDGEVIGESRILRRLSDSKMASIFVVVAPEGSEEKEAALKIFKGPASSDKAQQDFLDAVRAAARIQHPGFIRYLEAGVHDGNCYYVAEYLDSFNLAKRISQKAPFHEMECLETVRELGAALSYALASHGIFHRNLKPSNILYRKDGSPAIADYALASWESVNLAGCVSIASPWYISPEQVTGKRIGWSCDLYSLGVILFQMLTGVLPFHSTVESELLAFHLEAPFPLPEERNPNVRVSAPTIQILRSMTEKTPARRFIEWAEFLQAVDGSLNQLRAAAGRPKPFRPEKSGAAGQPSLPILKTVEIKRGKIIPPKKKARPLL